MVVVALMAAAPRAAQAQDPATTSDVSAAGVWMFEYVGAATFLLFSCTDAVYAMGDEWVPPEFAWPQLVFGGGLNATAGALMIAGMDNPGTGDDAGPVFWLGIATLSMGAWLILHSVLSLGLWEDRQWQGEGEVPPPFGW